MSVHWLKYPDADAAARACAAEIIKLLQEAQEEGRAATMAVSGGSTPKLLFGHLSESNLDWWRVHLFWVDERVVPPDDNRSNYRLAREHLIEAVGLPEGNVHRIRGELSAAEAAAVYDREIRSFFQLESGKFPRFDVIHLGTGADAHTASLFPGDPLIEDRSGITAAVHAPVEPRSRVTLLPSVLLSAAATVFLVAGDDKAEAVSNIFRQPPDPLRLPAQMVSQEARRVTWFLDEGAARLLA